MTHGKQVKLVSVLVCVFCALAALGSRSDLLVGTWKVDSLQYKYNIPDELKPTFEKSINDIKNSFLLTYNADGTYETSVNKQTIKGTWKLDETSSTITAKPDNGEEKQFKIIHLSEDIFSFSSVVGQDEVTFVMVPASSNMLYIVLVPVIISVSLILLLLFYKRNSTKPDKAG